MEDKAKHSKLRNISYKELKTQSYLVNKDIPLNNAIEVFRFRTRMSKFENNYGSSKVCPACGNHPDSQEELGNCEELKKIFYNIALLPNVYDEEVLPETARLISDIMKFQQHLTNIDS